VFFKKPVSSEVAHWLGGRVVADLTAAGLPACEAFPKQPHLSIECPFGNWVRLPGHHHKSDFWTAIREPDGATVHEGEAAVRRLIGIAGDDVTKLLKAYRDDQARIEAAAEAGGKRAGAAGSRADRNRPSDEAGLRSALQALPDSMAKDYDQWLGVGMALHHWDSSRGLSLWKDFSARCREKYHETVCDQKWATFSCGGSDGLTARSIFYEARNHGWRGFAAPKQGRDDIGTSSASSDGQQHQSNYGKPDRCDRYLDTGSEMFVMNDGEWVRIGQFSARIVEEIIRHEAGGLRRQYRIVLKRCEGRTSAEVVIDAKDYEAMAWVHQHAGPGWIIEPGFGNKDKLRAAIQAFSRRDGYASRVVATSTGWFSHDGQALFLHGGGAIDANGPTDAVSVELAPTLARYRLPAPPTDPAVVRDCIEAHLRILDLGKVDRPGACGMAAALVTLPMRCLIDPVDGVVHFSGATATRKTSTARLVLQHYANDMTVNDALSVSWHATAASLQRFAYDAANVCLIVDDLKTDRAVATATDFIQCQGNLKARDRMDRNLRLAPSLDPRCGVLSTGEADPTSQSTLGRMLTVRFTQQTVDLGILTRCQADAAAGRYANLVASYVRWLASRLDQIRREHAALVDRLGTMFRQSVVGLGVHPRHPLLAAQLAAGYRPFLDFAVASDAIERVTAEAYSQRIDTSLLDLVREQAEAQAESSTAERFVAMLIEGLRQQRFHLKAVDSDNAPLPYAGACGWHKDWQYEGGNPPRHYLDWCVPANSKMIGFIDVEACEVYLSSDALQVIAQSVARDQGKRFEGAEKIGRDLADAKMIRTTTETGADGGTKTRLQVRKRIKDHGSGRYYAIPTDMLFERDDESNQRREP
jgi:hypothetical protein